MEFPPTKRALVALAALIGATAALAGVYIHRLPYQLNPLSASAIPEIVQELPPNASVVSYINVASLRKLNNSPLAKIWTAGSGRPIGADREYSDFVRDTGFDYTHDLDQTAVAFWPAAPGASNRSPEADRFLVIADGRFDLKKIDAYARRTGKVVAHDGRTIYEIPGKSPFSVAFLSPTRIVFASGTDMIGSSSRPSQDSNTAALMSRVGGAPFFAALRTGALADSYHNNFGGSPQIEGLIRSVQGLTLAGQPEGENIQVVVDGECDTAVNANQFASLLEVSRMGGSLALANARAKNQMLKAQAELLERVLSQLKISHQDRWVRISLDVTPAMLESASSSPVVKARP